MLYKHLPVIERERVKVRFDPVSATVILATRGA